ncbi:UNKNOWN [Stylonychia lemnae]|uniref:Uncharacterized protein n=1 Tax=Stylonychia lemnae TaxID=5949 RepID=A0A078A028_STYLE|nr:UNKNOWN [Stylonychia lemnae]|eukprot:CDW74798.1 UNKNOWN [Stylonychia lemnae]
MIIYALFLRIQNLIRRFIILRKQKRLGLAIKKFAFTNFSQKHPLLKGLNMPPKLTFLLKQPDLPVIEELPEDEKLDYESDRGFINLMNRRKYPPKEKKYLSEHLRQRINKVVTLDTNRIGI